MSFMNKTILKTALLAALGVSSMVASFTTHAAAVNNGDQLTITQGVQLFDTNGNPSNVNPGSWFGMDTNASSTIAGTEKTPIGQGSTGLVIGTTTSAGASHGGLPTAGDTNDITAPWGFFGNTGSDFVTTAVTGSTTAGLNFSGWTVTWNGIPAIPMGAGAWAAGFSNGVGNFTWDGVYGNSYVLDYHGTVPTGDPSGFGGVKYALHMVGVVNAAAVPVPAAVWLFGSGLLGLVGIARRKKKA
jgi:hypothetical protein